MLKVITRNGSALATPAAGAGRPAAATPRQARPSAIVDRLQVEPIVPSRRGSAASLQWGIVLRLGSAVLASVLMGVPRALDTRAFGAPRSVYIQVAPDSPELAAFAADLSRALADAGVSVATGPAGATLVVDVHGLWRSVERPVKEAIRLTARDCRGTRRLVLHYAPEDRGAAARALLRSLERRSGGTILD
jgi:hypothetical protein